MCIYGFMKLFGVGLVVGATTIKIRDVQQTKKRNDRNMFLDNFIGKAFFLGIQEQKSSDNIQQ